jgi:hypothetical protein
MAPVELDVILEDYSTPAVKHEIGVAAGHASGIGVAGARGGAFLAATGKAEQEGKGVCRQRLPHRAPPSARMQEHGDAQARASARQEGGRERRAGAALGVACVAKAETRIKGP